MGSAAQRRLDASPRRHARWVYVRDAWPDAPSSWSPEAVLAAPEEAILEAIVRDRERYAELLHEERRRRAHAEDELERLQEAITLVLGVAARTTAPITGLAGAPTLPLDE